jgi:putative lipoic acid-binding regulatory protein
MNEDVFGGEILKFPIDCHYKIIAEGESVRVLIEIALGEMNITSPLLTGNHSTGGRYVTFNFDWTVDSQETMDRIDARLRAIEGVRLVL